MFTSNFDIEGVNERCREYGQSGGIDSRRGLWVARDGTLFGFARFTLKSVDLVAGVGPPSGDFVFGGRFG
jgi:hypothetical protein